MATIVQAEEKVLTLVFKLASAPRLALEFLAQLLQQLIQAVVWCRHHPAVCVIHYDRFRQQAIRRLDRKVGDDKNGTSPSACERQLAVGGVSAKSQLKQSKTAAKECTTLVAWRITDYGRREKG